VLLRNAWWVSRGEPTLHRTASIQHLATSIRGNRLVAAPGFGLRLPRFPKHRLGHFFQADVVGDDGVLAFGA